MVSNKFKLMRVLFWPIAIGALYSADGTAASQSCGEIALKSGSLCGKIGFKTDLSGCQDSFKEITTVKCGENAATFLVIGQKYSFRVKLVKEDNAWGDWKIKSITQKNLSTKEDRTPAGNRPYNVPVRETKAPSPNKDEVASATPKPANPSALQISTYFDLYYGHNFNNTPPASASTVGGMPNAQNNLRAFDWYSNQLALNLVELTLKHQRQEVALLIDLDFGQLADINAQAPAVAGSGGPNASTIDSISKHIGQAIATYTPQGVPGLTIEAGKMATHVGLEMIKPKDNWNYTRAAIFTFGSPFWHTGFHVGYAVIPERLTASVYLYQGWNTIYDTNSAPTVGGQLKWTPNSSITWIYNYIGGPEQAGNSRNWKQVHDTNIVVTVNDSLSLATDILMGHEKDATLSTGIGDAAWQGIEVLGKWQVHRRFSLSPRVEAYQDINGYTLGGEKQTLFTYTLTNAFQVTEGFELRLEARHDKSSSDQRFITNRGTASTQTTAVLGLLYSF